MQKEEFYTINEIEKLLQEEEFVMNLTTFNRFLLQRFQRRIDLIADDEIIQLLGNPNTDEEVLKETVQYCYEQAQESNRIVDRNYRSYYKIIDELDELMDRDDDSFVILQKMEKGEDVFVWELYSIALNKLYHPRIRRFLISVRAMDTARG